MSELPRHVSQNRRYWDQQAPGWVLSGEQRWAATEPVWGVWKLPETEVELFPADLTGRDAIELGCGTGYVAGWMARRGARVVGIDNSAQQLATARRLAADQRLRSKSCTGSPLPNRAAMASLDPAPGGANLVMIGVCG